jgi:hypothetical protein
MIKERPVWVEKFSRTNIEEEWCDRTLSEYPNSLVSNLPNSTAPENFAIINPLDIQNHKEISHIIDVPNRHTVPDVLMFVMDMLEDFAEALPRQDREIHQLYNQMDNSEGFYTDYDFADFYVFCRRIQYADMSQLRQYKLFSNLQETNTLPNEISVGSVTEVEYNGQLIDIKVEGFRETDGLLTDSNVVVSVVDDSIEEKRIILPPSSFVDST